jgi:hypothetical protein
VSTVPGYHKDEGSHVVTASMPSSLAVDQCEITEIVDALASGEPLFAVN